MIYFFEFRTPDHKPRWIVVKDGCRKEYKRLSERRIIQIVGNEKKDVYYRLLELPIGCWDQHDMQSVVDRYVGESK